MAAPLKWHVEDHGDSKAQYSKVWAGTDLGSAGPEAILVLGVSHRCDLFGHLSEKRESMPLLCVVLPQKPIFCCADFGSTIALDFQQKLKPSYILLKNKWYSDLFLELIALSSNSEVLFVKYPWRLVFFVGLFFGCIHFHAGPCCRPRKYRLAVYLITCT